MSEESKTVSYSQYSMWLNCPKQWKLTYVDKLKDWDDSIDTVFGTAMHNTIQSWLPMHFEDPKKAKKWDMSSVLKEELVKAFQETIKEENGQKIFVTTPEVLQEYYEDGCAIMDHVQKYGSEFFPTKNHKLIGCEVELEIPVSDNITFRAFLDIVIQDTEDDEYIIIDLKTSKAGWWKFQKQDPKKLHQLLLYKKYFSQKYNVKPEQIIPKFIILKRKIKESSDFIIRRLTNFEPSHGKISMSKMNKSWNKFITECFDSDGNRNSDVIATPSKSACRFCPYNNDKSLCSTSYYLEEE